MTLLKEGKNKKVFSVPGHDNLVLMEFKDTLTAFNNQKQSSLVGKGHVCREITALMFRYLQGRGITNHYVEDVGEKSIKALRLRIIPLEVVVRNVVAGALARKLGLPQGQKIRRPIVEFYYKDDQLGDPFLNDDQILMLELLSHPELVMVKEKAQQINAHLQALWREVGILLVDFKIEFGRDGAGLIVLADEISPDSCRLWDEVTHEPFDKDRFRNDKGGVSEAYQTVLSRLRKRGMPG